MKMASLDSEDVEIEVLHITAYRVTISSFSNLTNALTKAVDYVGRNKKGLKAAYSVQARIVPDVEVTAMDEEDS
jgi:hypothetical protein